MVTEVKDVSHLSVVVEISPNPTNNLLTINSESDFTKVELLSITGQILLSESFNKKTHQLQLQKFLEGIYFVRVSYADERSVTKKVIVSR